MKLTDIAGMAVHNLWQRRFRTALNLVGIVIGCIILLMTFAGAGGVKVAIHALFNSSEFARQIGVFVGGRPSKIRDGMEFNVEGRMSEERRERIRQAMINEWRRNRPQPDWSMTPEVIAEMSTIPHVDVVAPSIDLQCAARLDDTETTVTLVGTLPDTRSMLERVIAGRGLKNSDRRGVLIDEYLAYRLGFHDDDDLANLIGRTIEIEYRVNASQISTIYKLLTQKWSRLSSQDFSEQTQFMAAFLRLVDEADATSLSAEQKQLVRRIVDQSLGTRNETRNEPEEINVNKSFEIVGVVKKVSQRNVSDRFRRYFHDNSSGEMYLHHEEASAIYLADPKHTKFYGAIVAVDRTENLESVSEAIEAMGGQAESALWMLENIDKEIDRAAWIVHGIAAAVLLTSAIGISNTLIISVLERTPEFGILKSVGATDGDLVTLMIIEGGILGFAGAVVAIASSQLLALFGDRLLEWYVEGELGSDIGSNLFQFSVAPALCIITIAVVICAFASVLPAWRAAKLDPVAAMRRT